MTGTTARKNEEKTRQPNRIERTRLESEELYRLVKEIPEEEKGIVTANLAAYLDGIKAGMAIRKEV